MRENFCCVQEANGHVHLTCRCKAALFDDLHSIHGCAQRTLAHHTKLATDIADGEREEGVRENGWHGKGRVNDTTNKASLCLSLLTGPGRQPRSPYHNRRAHRRCLALLGAMPWDSMGDEEGGGKKRDAWEEKAGRMQRREN